MQRAEIRVVEPQQEQTTSVEIHGSEADALLAKYGFKQQPQQSYQPPNPDADLTVDELLMMQQREIEHQNHRRQNVSYTSDGRPGYSEDRYATIEGTEFGIRVQVVSDMPINGRY